MIVFNSRDEKYKSPFGAVKDNDEIHITIALDRKYASYHLKLLLFADDGSGLLPFDMKFTGFQDYLEVYEVTFCVKKAGLYWYRFEYEGQGNKISIGKDSQNAPALFEDHSWQLLVYEKDFKVPNWFLGGIMYQIFPDRFYNSPKYRPKVREDAILREDWGGEIQLVRHDDGSVPNNYFFGGNLKGIQDKLEYLKSLHVSVIYLNPIFEAASNHKYDTGDYEKIDGMFGDEAAFEELCSEAEQKGIKIILDGVFSHTGADSRYFNQFGKYKELGAYQSKDSKYYSWYDFSSWPHTYKSWWGVTILPEVKEEDREYLEYITGENGVLAHWLKKGASGFRLDVADELPDVFLDALRKRMKKVNKDSLIIGEVWEDASNKISYGYRRRYFQGKQLDSVMNYVFKDAIIDFVKTGDGEAIGEKVISICENYPKPALHALMNSLGTHDTRRILTQLDGNMELLKQAVFIQFFLPGVPCIYYGDEAGLDGEGDPFCRKCFPWGAENKAFLEFYQKLGSLREACTGFAQGEYLPLYQEKGLYGFLRAQGEEKIGLIINKKTEKIKIENEKIRGFLRIPTFETIKGFIEMEPGEVLVLGQGGWLKALQGSINNAEHDESAS